MESRVQISPKNSFLKIPQRWRREFAEEAVEYIMAEGLYSEIMTRITGLTPSDLTKESSSAAPVKITQHKKQIIAAALTNPVTKPTPAFVALQDPKSISSIMLSIVNKRGNIAWDELCETLNVDYEFVETDSLDVSLQMLCKEGYLRADGVGGNKSIFKI